MKKDRRKGMTGRNREGIKRKKGGKKGKRKKKERKKKRKKVE